MKIQFSSHCKDRLKQRGISGRAILASIKNPDSVDTSYRKRKLIRKRYSGRILEIVTRK